MDMEKLNFKVCVRCYTYNQSKYITDTMDGFSMQKTEFPYVCCIVDDASTDGEGEILKKYLSKNFSVQDEKYSYCTENESAIIYFAQHKTNKNCFFSLVLLKYNHYSLNKSKLSYLKSWRELALYDAMCEGDDYWIDEYKLQKQTEILDADKEVLLVHTGFITVDTNNIDFTWKKYNHYQEISKKEKGLVSLLDKNHIMTLTIMHRKEVIESVLYRGSPYPYDYAIFLSAALLGKIKFIPQKMCAYRKTPTGEIQSRASIVKKELYIVYRYFIVEILKNADYRRKLHRNIIAYFYILANLFFNGDYRICKKVFAVNPIAILIAPFAYFYASLKRIKSKL